jgi:hypothetical protein
LLLLLHSRLLLLLHHIWTTLARDQGAVVHEG